MKRQYRLTTEANWQSSFGMAILAFINASGSGRKLTFKSLEIQAESNNSLLSYSNVVICASANGESMRKYITSYDSSATLSNNVRLFRNAVINSETNVVRRISTSRYASAAGTHNTLFAQRANGQFSGSIYTSQTGSDLEQLTLNNNQTFALVGRQPIDHNSPLRITLDFRTGSNQYSATFVCYPKPGLAMCALENTSGSVVTIIRMSVQEVGSVDTPYLRVVPVGQIKSEFFGNTGMQIQEKLLKMDSSYPDLSYLQIYTDVDLLPLGVPASYISEGSTGTPKGFNYMHTKDFEGPCYRILFPEFRNSGLNITPDDRMVTFSMKGADIGFHGSGICINPGEGLAIVASAETAVGVQASFSGWPALTFSAQLEDSPVTDPVLKISNIVSGSDVVIIEAGTSNVLASVDELVGTTWEWAYDPDIVSSIDIAVYKAGYMPYPFANLPLGTSSLSLPISQTPDPSYLS
jgi:hypothetical protein